MGNLSSTQLSGKVPIDLEREDVFRARGEWSRQCASSGPYFDEHLVRRRRDSQNQFVDPSRFQKMLTKAFPRAKH
jgi:hypothetical protein